MLMLWLLLYLIPLACCPLAFFWSTCACCPQDCTIDDSDMQSLTGWTQDAGSWSVVSSSVVTSSSNAALKADSPDSRGTGFPVFVQAYLNVASSGSKARVCCDYLDKDNYVALELEAGSSSGLARVIRRVAGVETVSSTAVAIRFATTSTDIVLNLFYKPSSGEARCEIYPSGVLTSRVAFTRTATTTGGTFAAIATGSTSGSITFKTGFLFERHVASQSGCAAPGCVVHMDSTGSSAEFTSVSGFWSGLSAFSTGLIVSTIPDFTASDNYRLSATTTYAYGGLVFDYLDTNNYHVIKRDTGGGTVAKLYKRSAGVDVEVYNFGGSVTGAVSVCVNESSIVAAGVRISSTLHGGTQFGFWADIAVSTFSDFTFQLQRRCNEIDPERACEYCGQCDDNDSPDTSGARYQFEVPDEMAVVISGVTTTAGCNCAPINGTHIVANPRKHTITPGLLSCGWVFPYPLPFPCDSGNLELLIQTDAIRLWDLGSTAGNWHYNLTATEKCSIDSLSATLTGDAAPAAPGIDGRGCDWSAALIQVSSSDVYAN